MRRSARRLIGRPAFWGTVVVAIGVSLSSTLTLRWLVASFGLPVNLQTRLILAVPVVVACCALGLWLPLTATTPASVIRPR